MNIETLPKNPGELAASSLVEQLMTRSEQLQLFEPNPYAHFAIEAITALRVDNQDKLVIDCKTVDEFRLRAAYLGAGFPPSDYQDIMYKKNDPEEVGKLVLGRWQKRARIKSHSPRSNRMRDEVLHNELFTEHVRTTQYDLTTSHYVTTIDDLRKIFEFDYANLRACRSLDFDLLYERED